MSTSWLIKKIVYFSYKEFLIKHLLLFLEILMFVFFLYPLIVFLGEKSLDEFLLHVRVKLLIIFLTTFIIEIIVEKIKIDEKKINYFSNGKE